MADVRLEGCRPAPLGPYLKALAVLRLVAEQADPDAEGWWEADRFILRSSLDADSLVDFLSGRYRPSPLLSPWNGGSGFGPKDVTSSPTAVAAVARVAASDDPRLASYRAAIEAVRRIAERPDWATQPKETQVALCRNALPDDALAWIDATVVLTGDGRAFPFLLGTGGNDGRLDFSSNFMQRLAEVFGLVPRPRGGASARELARAVLFDDTTVRLDRGSIGQFDPGAANGVGASPYGAESLANPWDLVLVLEGALMFASAAARRMSTGRAAVAVPFMVSTSPVGHASASGEKGRGELWAPLWHQPATAAEIGRLLAEGRADYGGHQARNGLDAARAVASLGVDRGIEAFERHAFLERNGLATFAVPVGRLVVRERAGASLLGQLDRWTGRLRGAKNPPGALPPLLRALDNAQFAVTTSADQVAAVQRVLVAVADVEHLVLRSGVLAGIGPVRGLRVRDWLPAIADGSTELELAVALASLRVRRAAPSTGDGVLRALFSDLGGRADPPVVPGVASRPMHHLLAEAHVRLAIDHPPSLVEGERGPQRRWLAHLDGRWARPGAVAALATGNVDDVLLRQLLRACLLLDWRSSVHGWDDEVDLAEKPRPGAVPPALALLAPAFHHLPWTAKAKLAADPEARVPELPVAAPSWPRQLLVGQTAAVLEDGVRRLRIAGWHLLVRDGRALAVGADGPRLSAAGLVPQRPEAIAALLRRVTTEERQEVS